MKDKLMSWEEAVLWLKKQSNQKQSVMDCYYDDPLPESAERFHTSTEWRSVQKILSRASHGKALDIGAGRGISSYALARDGWSVTALEPNPSMAVGSGAIKRLKETTKLNITIIKDYGETLPFMDNHFDLVYGRAVLHHADQLKKFCAEMVRVLKPGGVLMATREHVISRKKDLQSFLDSHLLHSLYKGENAFLLSEYLKAFKEAGLNMKHILSPYDSNINLFPTTQQEIKRKVTRKIKLYVPGWFFNKIMIPLLNKIDNTPGRLYTFIGTK